jgi:preprotein translocase subunit SecG
LLTTIITIVQLLACAVLILVVLLQSGKTAGLSGAIGGGADTYLSKNKGKTLDSKLARATKWIAIVFVVLTLALSIF